MKEVIIKLSNDNYVIDKKYKRPGVWALWGKNNHGIEVCLEVGQTKNMLLEINQDIEILRTLDSDNCINCGDIYPASERHSYSESFNVHECKKCKNKSYLRRKYASNSPRRVDKYKDIMHKYKELEFILVDNSVDKSYEERRLIEKEYAIEHKALYWYS